MSKKLKIIYLRLHLTFKELKNNINNVKVFLWSKLIGSNTT